MIWTNNAKEQNRVDTRAVAQIVFPGKVVGALLPTDISPLWEPGRMASAARGKIPPKAKEEAIPDPASLLVDRDGQAPAVPVDSLSNSDIPAPSSVIWDVPSRRTGNRLRLLLLTLMLAVGVAGGSLLIRFEQTGSGTLLSLLQSWLASGANRSFAAIFWQNAAATFPFLIAAFILGMSAPGALLVLFLPLMRGLCIGVSVGEIYAAQSGAGIAYVASFYLPHTLISTAALLFACRESLRFSIRIFSAMLPARRPVRMWTGFRTYLFRYGILTAVSLAAAALDAALSSTFA